MYPSRSIAPIPIWKRWFCKPVVNVQLGETEIEWSRAPILLRCPSDLVAVIIDVDGHGELFINGRLQAKFCGFYRFDFRAAGGSTFDLIVRNTWGKTCVLYEVPERNIPHSDRYIGIGVIGNAFQLRYEPTVTRSAFRDVGHFSIDTFPGISVVKSSTESQSSIQVIDYRYLQPNLSVIKLDDILDDVTHEIAQRGLRT
jgi:hypothetical protein